MPHSPDSGGGAWTVRSAQNASGPGKTRLVVTVVVLIAVLAVIGSGAVWVVLGMQEATQAAATAQSYCAALQRKQYSAAYALLSPGEQGQIDSATYTLTEELHDDVDGPVTRCSVPQPGLGTDISLGPRGTRETVSVQITRQKVLSGPVTLSKVGGAWRVQTLASTLAGTDVEPLVVEEQFCAALLQKDYSTAERAIAASFSAQMPATHLAATFGNSTVTTLSACTPTISSYQLAANDAAAQVLVSLDVKAEGLSHALAVPAEFTFARGAGTAGATAAAGWGISAVHLAPANLPANTPVATFGTPHLPATAAAPPSLSSAAAMLVNPVTNEVYLGQNVDAERAMASTTKITTALVALTLGQLTQPITVGPDANGATLVADYGASVAGLQTGEVLTLHDLLYGLLLPSGDDAAVAIAEGIAGSQQNFVALMNMEAGLLGLRDTHYSDVHGLDAAGHYTSVRDLLTLTEYALHYAAFTQIVGTPTYTLPATAEHQAYFWTNTNLLLTTDAYPGATGVKTGFTGNAGGCLVFSAQQGGHQLLGVVLGEPSGTTDSARFIDATALLTWGFGLEQQGL